MVLESSSLTNHYFPAIQQGEEKVKQTEGSKCLADDSHKDDVTVEPALKGIVEPIFR